MKASLWFLIIPLLILAILSIYALIFGSLVLPIWAIVDCVRSPNATKEKRILWVLLNLLFWSLAAVIYGAFVTSNLRLRKHSRFVGIIIILSLLSVPLIHRKFGSKMEMDFTRVERDIDNLKTIEGDLPSIKSSIATLRTESDIPWYKVDRRKEINEHLLTILRGFLNDRALSKSEVEEWHKLFEARSIIGADVLAQRAMELQLASIKNFASNMQAIQEDVGIKATKSRLRNLINGLERYFGDNLQYPTTKQGLLALVEKPTAEPIPSKWDYPYVGETKETLVDYWGHPYVYEAPIKNKQGFTIFSRGPNGQGDGTEPDDIGNIQSPISDIVEENSNEIHGDTLATIKIEEMNFQILKVITSPRGDLTMKKRMANTLRRSGNHGIERLSEAIRFFERKEKLTPEESELLIFMKSEKEKVE